MDYEAHWSPGKNWALAASCLVLVILGLAAAGVIPTASGANPLVGWAIVGASLAAILVFARRATNGDALVRADSSGLFVRAVAPQPIPWSEVAGIRPFRAGIQRITRIELRDPAAIQGARGLSSTLAKVDRAMSYGHFGVNTTFYDRGQDDLVAAIRAHAPHATG
ncbi:MAG TPA: hypothetical protein VHG29_05265 [Novosphingobium sp.]|nr:hypothetical protein [Novosphingobium sp.]